MWCDQAKKEPELEKNKNTVYNFIIHTNFSIEHTVPENIAILVMLKTRKLNAIIEIIEINIGKFRLILLDHIQIGNIMVAPPFTMHTME